MSDVDSSAESVDFDSAVELYVPLSAQDTLPLPANIHMLCILLYDSQINNVTL